MLTDLQHIQGWGGDGDTIVVARHSWHLGVNDLPRTSSNHSEHSQTQGHMPYKLTATPTPASKATTTTHPWQHRNCKVQSMHWGPTPGPTKTPYSQSPDSPVLDRRDSRCTWPIPLSGAPEQRQQHQWKSTCCSVPPLEKGEPQNQDQQENPQHTQHSHKA